MEMQRIATKAFRIRQRGQGMTEYIIITALIAIAAIAAVTYFGHTARAQIGGMANELSGHTATNDIQNAETTASRASNEGNREKTLNSYNNDTAQ